MHTVSKHQVKKHVYVKRSCECLWSTSFANEYWRVVSKHQVEKQKYVRRSCECLWSTSFVNEYGRVLCNSLILIITSHVSDFLDLKNERNSNSVLFRKKNSKSPKHWFHFFWKNFRTKQNLCFWVCEKFQHSPPPGCYKYLPHPTQSDNISPSLQICKNEKLYIYMQITSYSQTDFQYFFHYFFQLNSNLMSFNTFHSNGI